MSRGSVAVMLCVVVGLVAGTSAAATAADSAGEIMYPWIDASGKAEYTSSGLAAFDVMATDTRGLITCLWDGWNYHEVQEGRNRDCLVGDGAAGPDGDRIATVLTEASGEHGERRQRIAVVTAHGEELRSVPLDHPASDPTWSPDGRSLLVTSTSGDAVQGAGSSRLIAIDMDTGASLPIGSDGASDADWSVTGEIAYVRDGEIWVTTLGGPELRLTTDGGTAPSWSPDGRRLAFVRGRRIWTIEDGRERQVSDVPADAPAWSPDGRHIAFLQQYDYYSGELWLMRSDGRCAHLLKRAGVWSKYGDPFWRPLPDGYEGPRLRDLVCGREARPDLRPAKRRIGVRGRGFAYRFRAVPGFEGWAKLRTRIKALVPTRKGLRRRHLRFSQRFWDGPLKRRFEVGSRGTVRLDVRLTRRQRRILRLNGRLQLWATVAVRDDARDLVTTRKRLTLLAPRRGRRG